MRIGPIVEGESEEKAIPKLLQKLGIACRKPIVTKGKPDLLLRAPDYAEMHLSKGATHILFCFDADSTDGVSELTALRERMRTFPVLGFVPVYELEAWLLADEEALSTILRVAVGRITKLESDSNPKRTLSHLLSRHGRAGGYRPTRDAHIIAELARDVALTRCASYVRSTQAFREAPR